MSTIETIPEVRAPETSRFVAGLRHCFSFPVLLGAMLVGGNFLVVRTLRLDPDTWMHIKLGESILDTGKWPTFDIYSFTAGGVFRMAFEWLGEVAIALAWRLGGLRGMDWLLIALTSIILLLLYYYAHLRCANSKAAFLGVVVTFPLAAMCFTLRPQLLGFSYLLVVLICLERFRRAQQKSLWLLPPLFLVWVNTHGTFALGLFVLGLYWASGMIGFTAGGLEAEAWTPKQRRHLALVLLLCLIAVCITPYGTRLTAYPIDMAFSQPVGVGNVQEWQPISFTFWQAKLLLVVLVGFLLALVTLRPRYRLEELALLLFAIYAACTHFRFVVLFAFVFAPLLASILARWVPNYEPKIDKRILNAVLILAVIVGMAKGSVSRADQEKHIADAYPVAAVEYLRGHPVAEPMFNDYGFGGYLLWSMGPAHKVFIDGRADLYEQSGAFADYMRIALLKPDALALLQKYGIRSCMVEADSPIGTLLAARADWKQVYKDKVAVLFVRVPEGQHDPSGAAR